MVAVNKRHISPAAKHGEKRADTAFRRPGLLGQDELSVADRSGPSNQPIKAAWISDELLADTIDVWSRAYDRPVATEEALEILANVRRFGELLIQAKEERKA